MNPSSLRPHPLGDSAATISFGITRSPELLARIHSATRVVAAANIPFVDDVVPAYLALTVFFDSHQTTYDAVVEQVIQLCQSPEVAAESRESRLHVIPVEYEGIDLELVAEKTGLSVADVIARHTARRYSVDLLGFVPGFAYLSELDQALQLPRRAQPRPRVAAGSVAIAGAQTGVYPLDTPGGWHILGRTATSMFDPAREPPALLAPGDSVRFEAVRA